MGKYLGPSFLTLEEARANEILKRGDVIQIRRSIQYMHAVLFDDYDNCFHVVKYDNTDGGANFMELLKKGTTGTFVYIRKHPLEEILRKGDHNSDDDDYQPKYDIFRVYNEEEEARKRGVNLETVNSITNLDKVFDELREITNRREEIKFFYHFAKKNCECYVYEWKYCIGWSPQSQFWKRIFGYSLLNGVVFGSIVCGKDFSGVTAALTTFNVIYENWETLIPYGRVSAITFQIQFFPKLSY
jgi:hypothetical protein